MRNLKKNSKAVRLAYCYGEARGNPPDAISLCKLFWRCVGGCFVGIGLGILYAIIYFIMAGLSVAFFMFGRRFKTVDQPSKKKPGEVEQVLQVHYFEHWPAIKGARITPALVVTPFSILVGYRPAMFEGDNVYFTPAAFMPLIAGVRLPLGLYILGVFALYGVGLGLYSLYGSVTPMVSSWSTQTVLIGFGVGLLILAVLFFRSDFWALIKGVASATKEKTCPIIGLED